jgi:hypothetical protein
MAYCLLHTNAVTQRLIFCFRLLPVQVPQCHQPSARHGLLPFAHKCCHTMPHLVLPAAAAAAAAAGFTMLSALCRIPLSSSHRSCCRQRQQPASSHVTGTRCDGCTHDCLQNAWHSTMTALPCFVNTPSCSADNGLLHLCADMLLLLQHYVI